LRPTRVFSVLFRHAPTPGFYPLSLHDALPISQVGVRRVEAALDPVVGRAAAVLLHVGAVRARFALELGALPEHFLDALVHRAVRSEEHTSELQSRENLVCRLLLEKKKYNHQRT